MGYNRWQNGNVNGESVAPYNFVSLYDNAIERYKSIDELPSHGKYEKGCINGHIDYTIESKSPIIVSEGNDYGDEKSDKVYCFFKNQNGEYAIPGSTMRGLIRNNVQILGLGTPADDIEDNIFLYRALADKNTKLKNQYTKMIDITPENKTPGKVRAGYIYRAGEDKYIIVPAIADDHGKTFYGIREPALRKAQVRDIGIRYMYKREIVDFRHNPNANKKGELNEWYSTLKRNQNGGFRYVPYVIRVSFDAKYLDNGGINLLKIDKREANLPQKGYILCSGFMPKKVTHYLINDIDMNGEKVGLKEKEVRVYKDDLDSKFKKSDPRYAFYKLPEEYGIENAKPIFYVKGEKLNYFGYTPYLRIFYDGSVYDGISSNLKRDILDYSKSMFGFTNYSSNKESYKSRLSFEDANIVNMPRVLEERSLVLGQPKPTCYPDYIDQNGTYNNKRLTYNDVGKFKIRGIKQYWLKDVIAEGKGNDNKNVAVRFKPIDEGAVFKGTIYFNNLHKDELGLLLWALRLEDGCYQNIGLAKPYGYGKIEIKDIKMYVEDIDKKYSGFTFDFYEKDEGINDYIEYYKRFVKDSKGIDLDSVRSIKEFFILKSAVLSKEESRYMEIKNSNSKNEFADRNALPTPLKYSEKSHLFRDGGIFSKQDSTNKE